MSGGRFAGVSHFSSCLPTNRIELISNKCDKYVKYHFVNTVQTNCERVLYLLVLFVTKGRSRANVLLDRFFSNFYCGEIMNCLFQKMGVTDFVSAIKCGKTSLILKTGARESLPAWSPGFLA